MYCAVIQTQNASKAELNLTRLGFPFYNPKVSKRTPAGESISQLFPRYMFVWIRDCWRELRSTPGIINMIMTYNVDGEQVPARVSEQQIEALRQRENNQGVIVLTKPLFEQGQRVQVKSGPFAFERGLYDGQRDRERVYVLMGLLGQSCRVTVEEDNLVAC